MLQSIGFSRSSIEQIFVVTQLDIARHLTGYNIDIRPESGYYGEDEE